MLFIAMKTIRHPESCNVIVNKWDVLSVGEFENVVRVFGLDSLPVILCADADACERILVAQNVL